MGVIPIETKFPDLGILDNTASTTVLVGVLGIGVLITWLSTHFATPTFLEYRTDDLY
jgi:cell division transport system permease protein